jgi:hypothetical protein
MSSFLSKFKMLKREDTVIEPMLGGGSFLVTYKPIYVDVVKRH